MSYENTVPKTETELFIRNFNVLMSKIHTTMPGEIVSYEGNRLGSVKPLIDRKLADGSFLSLPVIEDVPIVFPGGDNFGMTWPLKKGTPVMLHICERSIEDWLQNGKVASPEDLRRFSLTDAVAVPGIYNKSNPYPEANNVDFQILYKDATIKIKEDGCITLNGESKVFVTHSELNTALQGLVGAINTQLLAILAINTAAGSGTGFWPYTPALALGSLALDISASATTTIKTGG